jgi:predicted P-loop ATPase
MKTKEQKLTKFQDVLIKHGISKEDAEYFDKTFSNNGKTDDQFINQWVNGWKNIIEIMEIKDPQIFLTQYKSAPVAEPWRTIHGFIEYEISDKNITPMQAFSKASTVYDGKTREAIVNAIAIGLGKTQELKEKAALKGQKLTKDYKTALQNLGYSFRMREIDDSIEVNHEPLSDPKVSEILNSMTDRGFKVPKTITVIDEMALHNKYHPIKDYLNSLTWDGKNHIENLASYFSDAYGMFPIWLRKWLIGAVAKVFEAEQNPMLVLDGRQGIGKSEFVRWLAKPLKDYYIEGPINPNDKDCEIRLISYWVWEVSELGVTTRKSDYEALKAFLSTRKVTVRKPYGRRDIKKDALASFIGTINNSSGIFSDPTGSRRFLVSKVEDLFWDYSKDLKPDDVWAEAMAAYKDGEVWKLTPDELQKSNAINTEYDAVTPVEDMIRKYFELDVSEKDWFLPSADIFAILTDTTKGNIKGSNVKIYMDIKNTMVKLGHEKTVGEDNNGKRVNGYKGIRLQSSPFVSASMNP